jgi:hypothetical protein
VVGLLYSEETGSARTEVRPASFSIWRRGMAQNMVWRWINDAFHGLPGCDDVLFRNLWIEGRLRFQGSKTAFDDVDIYSARLVSACISTNPKGRLLIVLPDSDVRRPAALLATAILRHWGHCLSRSPNGGSGTILYFGSTIGIREHLRQTTVQGLGLNLADALRQEDISARGGILRSASRTSPEKTQASSTLPKVRTIYAPADAALIVNDEKPALVTADIGVSTQLSWLRPLIDATSKLDIPVIAWGQNPLSECVEIFSEKCSSFLWPRPLSLHSDRDINDTQGLEPCFSPSITTKIQPLVMEGNDVEVTDPLFRAAARSLHDAASKPSGKLGDDAIRLHWNYLRSLERLCVPVDLYEAESPTLWGIRPFGDLRAAAERFRIACEGTYPLVAAELHGVGGILDSILESMKEAQPPLWHVLCDLSIDEPSKDEVRILAFSSQARKQLFLFSLLAKFNIAEQDLVDLRIRVMNLKEIGRALGSGSSLGAEFADPLVDPETTLRIQFVGIPSPLSSVGMLPLLALQNLEFVIYPHQLSGLQRQVFDWRRKLGPNFENVMAILSRYSGLRSDGKDFPPNKRFSVSAILLIDTHRSKVSQRQPSKEPLWRRTDPVAEVSRLLDSDFEDELADNTDTAVPSSADANRDIEPEATSWCENAIQVRFQDGSVVLFAPDETINVVLKTSNGVNTEERHVSALRPNDEVVLIQGQHRQSLYELIVSRVHRNAGFELHLALIRRWQDDLSTAFQSWRKHGTQNLDELLERMRKLGSRLTSSFTLRLWLWRRILCPDDIEDLRRIADVLDMGFVREHYKRIGTAASRLRGLHRGLSNRLNHWLERRASGVLEGDSDTLIDQELGLDFADFRNSLVMLRVRDIETVPGPFLLSSLGAMEKESIR